jgi:hypothetical protein
MANQPPAADVKPRLFTIPQTATITARSVPSVWRDLKAGRLEAVYINGSTRITGDSIERLCTPRKSA